MAELASSWSTVFLSDSSAVKLVGNWSADSPTSFHNVSYPETSASVAFTFHGRFPSIPPAVEAGSLISMVFAQEHKLVQSVS